ncbi:similar to Saccharomyces cerevisiae YDR243C PRP28 RNA helicase in the DEAD-box family, involved in RNA isomerization at the 5' splice site [Maudiozyma saulgeensis]|uniref:RNA helicase n=1 Tax=Maudiozyma saulgeensis TaxID=1789683 RepID=A0A1X7R606_9SACH|nr:similar to Saccharomyces cerevisiae YDR243C PRP28 RNA helicase in the DEAD-box family, involved in RNA isomerization at the 5' splice site [Kazachstania saulgeensis]
MARPVDVSQLLGTLKGHKSGNNIGKKPLKKAKFLSKSEREALLQSENTNVNNKKFVEEDKPSTSNENVPQDDAGRTSTESLKQEPSVRHSSTKSKFNFDWQNSDDTLTDYKPLTTLRVNDLLKAKSIADDGLNKIEESYLGKHWTQKKIGEMTERDWRILREDFQISIRGDSIKQPLRNWNELNLIPNDLSNIIIKDLRMENPTPIQRATIPNFISNNNRSVLGVASTGSGKTFAFIIPILTKLNQIPDRPRSIRVLEGPKALILAPTRELAQQIETEAKRITNIWDKHDYKVVSIVGGHSVEEISYELSDGCDILVATPGRLIDCLENHMLTMGSVSTVVLDEADKMIDLGFEEQLTTILNILEMDSTIKKEKRQIVMFTATMTSPIEKIARQYLNKPINISIGSSENTIPKIQQKVIYAPSDDMKFNKVVEQLRDSLPPVIIFINHKRIADILAEKLKKETRCNVVTLHGSKSQEQREKSLSALKNNNAQIMIATSIAARGLDIPNVSLVINYEMPKNFEDYVHRIGRTGRAGNIGTAITFIGEYEDITIVEKLQKYVETENPLRNNEFDRKIERLYKIHEAKSEYIIF